MNARLIPGLLALSYGLFPASSVAQKVHHAPPVEVVYTYPSAFLYSSGAGADDVQVVFSGRQYGVMEARLGDNVYRETLPEFAWFPWYGSFYPAPQQGAGAFALLDRRRPVHSS